MSEFVKVPDFAQFKIDAKKFYEDGLGIIVREIVNGIANRKAITGGDLPALEPETIMRKKHDQPLVDKGVLKNEYTYERTNQYRAGWGRVRIKPLSRSTGKRDNQGRFLSSTEGGTRDRPRDEVGAELQAGIMAKGKLKRFVFFGVSKDAEAKIMELAGELIKKAMEAL